MRTITRTFKELLKYPSAVASLLIIAVMLGISIYTFITIPYNKAIVLWRGGENIWYELPKIAQPAWTNYFRREKLPDTIILSTRSESKPANGSVTKTSEPTQAGEKIHINFTFDYPYDTFPQELAVYFTSKFQAKPPFVSLYWLTPDGRKIRVGDFSVEATETYRFSQDAKLQRRLGGLTPAVGLFAIPDSDPPKPLKGSYQLQIEGVSFEKGTELDAEFVLYGQVYGIAGTDHQRRDLMVALLWGLPVALSFGLIAALTTTMLTMLIAAGGVWFGGWVDSSIQRVTEVNMVLPLLPILIMIGTFYSRSIWIILGATIVLSIFTGQIKQDRAMFLQVKESSFVEAARAYGANNFRIISVYMIPRVIPTLIPQLVVLIPAYVFLEASLAVLGLGDPVLPTWGKIIQDAEVNGALYQGLYYWVLEPAFLLIITGLAFAMLGFALDRIFNPRLREM
jgi:peptide/nickel transport system permease protein